MKLITYRRDGAVCHGRLLDDETVHEWGLGDISEILVAGNTSARRTSDKVVPLTEIEVLAPLLRPGKVIAVAANYQDHVTESGSAPLDKTAMTPRLFLKPVTAVTGTNASIVRPIMTTEMDWEAELVVVIGRRSKDLSADAAMASLAGYCVGNDVSARSIDHGFELAGSRDTHSAAWFFDWLTGKSFDGFAAFGPHLTTVDEVPDPQNLAITLDVNGRRRQDSNTGHMIFGVAELVSFASHVYTLEPGDVIFTGTPAGVGAATGEYLVPDDRIVVRIDTLGELVNTVATPIAK